METYKDTRNSKSIEVNRFIMIKKLLTDPPYTSVFLYRVSNFFYRKKIPFIPRLLTIINRIIFGIEIGYTAQIGKGFRICHGAGCVIGYKTIIGENVTVNQGVTIGGNFNKSRIYNKTYITQPVIGDNVHIAAGAKVLGPVIIGSNTIIGANSVITKDVPMNSVVSGIPGVVIRENIKRSSENGKIT